jgi:hypoxanthine phosphoribosyltransferase
MKKLIILDAEFKKLVHKLCRDIANSEWRPDYVVGLTRGGLTAAAMISHYFDVPMETLKPRSESNCWMAEDAFGYIPDGPLREGIDKRSDATFKKKILVVDDINDTGSTLEWIREDWQSSCLPNDESWKYVWNKNVRFAVLINNESSNYEHVDYSGRNINKLDDPCWVVFPWENWWEA